MSALPLPWPLMTVVKRALPLPLALGLTLPDSIPNPLPLMARAGRIADEACTIARVNAGFGVSRRHRKG